MMYAKNSFFIRYATLVALTTVSLLIVFVGIVFYQQQQESNTAKGWVLHTYEVKEHIHQLFNRIKDVELGQRAFIISGDEHYLTPQYDALKQVPATDAGRDRLEHYHAIENEIKILRMLTSDNPKQQNNLYELDTYVKDLLGYWDGLHTPHDRRPARLDLNQDNQLLEHIRSVLNSMMAEENYLLSKRIKLEEANARQTSLINILAIGIFYFVMVSLIWLYHRNKTRSTETQETLITQLANSNTELERFAYVASHDMQEPLRMIANFGKLIATEYGGMLDEEGREYIQIMTQSAIRMQNMVADLLEYARIGNENLRIVTIDGAKELRHVLENLSTSIKEHDARVTYDTLPEFKGNPVQFMRLLQNLIANAIKYQKKENKPAIHVGVEEQEDNWLFCVCDNGIGVESEYLNQVFQPFKRLHTWQEHTGTGIGLAVCKKIVEKHGGGIWMTSELGKGSTVYFTIPKTKKEAS